MLTDLEYILTHNPLISYEIIERTSECILVKNRYKNGKEIESSYNIRTMDDICALINAGGALNLNGCYIKDFSYSFIQQKCGIGTILYGFSARGALFEGDTNFSNAIFETGEKDFRYTHFANGHVDFSNAQFNAGDVLFNETHFEKGERDFSEVNFGKGMVSFKSAQFDNGNVSFNKARFGEGDVYFEHARFDNGNVSFNKARFGNGNVSFNKARFGNGNASFNKARFIEGDVSFEEASFGNGRGNVSFRAVQFDATDVSFRSAYFDVNNVCFRSTQFKEGSFFFCEANFGEGEVDFTDAYFGRGRVSFYNTFFNNAAVSFRCAFFRAHSVDFSSASFGSKGANFLFTNFGDGDVDFSETSFDERCTNLHHAKFGDGTVTFQGPSTKNVAYAVIKELPIKQNIDNKFSLIKEVSNYIYSPNKTSFILHSIQFEIDNKIDLSNINAPLINIRFENCHLLQHDNFRVFALNKLEIINCILERTLLIDSVQGYSVNISSLSFNGTKNEGTIYLDWETARNGIHSYEKVELFKHMRSFLQKYSHWMQAKLTSCQYILHLKICKKLIFGIEHRRALIPFYTQQSKQFQMLKENFHNIGEYDHEDKAFVEYMRSYRQTQSVPMCFGLWLLDKIGEYGTKPRRLSCWMGGMVLVFGFIYGILLNWQAALEDKSTFFSIGKELASKILPDFLEHFVHGFYISAITFLTIGDNDIASRHFFSATLITAEGFFGLFLMSYFIVSLVRKTLR